LLHSFGLYSEVRDKKRLRRAYKFELNQGSGTLIKAAGPDRYEIDIQMVRVSFNHAALQYEKDLRNPIHKDNKEMLTSFNKMISKHGWIRIG
jgi:hypothetical protein